MTPARRIWQPWACVVLAGCCGIGSNSAFRAAGLDIGAGGLHSAAVIGRFLLGAGLNAVALVFYQAALSALPLSRAYPILVGIIMAGGTVIAVLILGDPFSPRVALGVACVFSGIVLLSGSRSSADDRITPKPSRPV